MAHTHNSEQHFEHLLKRHKLKRTEPRLRVLSMLSSKNVATSQPDLEGVIGDVDRVTLYRILSAFEEKGIIHKVFDLNGTANYALCSSDCGSAFFAIWSAAPVYRRQSHAAEWNYYVMWWQEHLCWQPRQLAAGQPWAGADAPSSGRCDGWQCAAGGKHPGVLATAAGCTGDCHQRGLA